MSDWIDPATLGDDVGICEGCGRVVRQEPFGGHTAPTHARDESCHKGDHSNCPVPEPCGPVHTISEMQAEIVALRAERDALRKLMNEPGTVKFPVEEFDAQIRRAEERGEEKGAAEIERLRGEVEDWRSGIVNAMGETPCRDASEQHCSCVPFLRLEIAALRGKRKLGPERYALQTIEEWEEILGCRVQDAARIAWHMARLELGWKEDNR